MGDLYYDTVVFLGRHAFWASGDAVVLRADRIPRYGPFILASTHTSPYDVPVLMRATRRRLDFVSITEVFKNPWVAWFFSNMNAFPHDRSKTDSKTVRIILERLQRGRVIALFPEGRVRPESESVVHGARFRPGVARVARMAEVKILPVVVWGTMQYTRLASWIPAGTTRYGINYGEPFAVNDEAVAERQLAEAYQRLYAELMTAMRKPGRQGAPRERTAESPSTAATPARGVA